jgi:TrmH family RNA methyltransferase
MKSSPSTSARPLSRAEVRQLKTLTTKKGREASGQLLVEGWKAVDELLSSSWRVETVVVDLQRIPSGSGELFERCRERSIELRSGTAADLRAISDVREDQGIVAVAGRPRKKMSDLPTKGDLLLLDGVADPGNVGTLIRTADWFGISGLILGPGCATVENPKVLRATMGSLFHVTTVEVPDLASACKTIAAQGVTLISADVEGGRWTEWVVPGRMGLILGSEAHGISPEVRAVVSHHVTIPRTGRAESLNVAAAGAILLASLAEHRHA